MLIPHLLCECQGNNVPDYMLLQQCSRLKHNIDLDVALNDWLSKGNQTLLHDVTMIGFITSVFQETVRRV